ncbi:hypothetical protein CBR_g19779 [Chara braunii]|uniref:Alpha/beta hydrolase fold-5 domain-containing protein n=1 Tax=Chara braunii TaxID=69332 RepID=A0A388JU00_CHABU|nr:hypothetical protein CBR_g19779 [Chara braunii]|eukprot:GBG61247.1 hypothetical protein CBR_g19779 [Chara braunii]
MPTASEPVPRGVFPVCSGETLVEDGYGGCQTSSSSSSSYGHSFLCEPDPVAMAAMKPVCPPSSPPTSAFTSLTVSVVPGVGYVFANATSCQPIKQSESGFLTGLFNATSGIVIIPEKGVDPRAYAPYARAMTAAGAFAVIVTDINEANVVRALSISLSPPRIWAVMGHGTYGGALATLLARSLYPRITTLILHAAAIPPDIDFSQGPLGNLDVVLNYGLLDSIVPPSKIHNSFQRVPGDVSANPFPLKGHYDFAYSTCHENHVGHGEGRGPRQESAMSAKDEMILLRQFTLVRPDPFAQTTARGLSYGDNTLLRPGRNDSKIYPKGGMLVEQIRLTLPQRHSAAGTKEPVRSLWILKPNHAPRGGYVYVAGAYVDPTAYFPFLFQVAAQGYLVALPQMERRLSLDPMLADQVLAFDHPILRTVPHNKWAIGGHSLGGYCAFSYASLPQRHNIVAVVTHSGLFTLPFGLLPSTVNLSQSSLPVCQIYGSLDGVVLGDPEYFRYSANDPPPRGRGLIANLTATRFIRMEGANHQQVGEYGSQTNDIIATIGHVEQETTYAQLTVDCLNEAMGYTASKHA